MAVAHGLDPVRWWVIDDFAPPVDLGSIPPVASSVWEAVYDNDAERAKRTTRDLDAVGLAPLFARLRSPEAVAEWSARLGYPVEDDHLLHGGGLHVTGPGGWLNTHLDYDRHPFIPDRRRALNLILFLNPEWRPEWGGALVLCDPGGEVVTRIEPKPGRLAAFEVGDLSYHGVEPVTGPVERVTAAVYYLSEATPNNTRRRALFLPTRG